MFTGSLAHDATHSGQYMLGISKMYTCPYLDKKDPHICSDQSHTAYSCTGRTTQCRPQGTSEGWIFKGEIPEVRT